MLVKKHLELLGRTATDKVTGFTGVVASVCFDLYGCIQVCLSPPVNKQGARQESSWYDVNRLTISPERSVMELPNFEYGPVAEGKQGANPKPPYDK